MRCEGFRRRGGMFTFGIAPWMQCENEATVMLTVEQDGQQQTLPSCNTCWDEGIERGITILKAEPIVGEEVPHA